MKSRLIWGLAIAMVVALGAIGASAQVDVSPGVARISYLHGDVSTERGDSGEWVAAALNAPVVTGDTISTGDNARAEVQFDYSNILRLGDHAQATLAEMTRNKIQVQIGEGIVNFDALKGGEAEAEIDTPNVAIHPGRGGASFRVIVNSAEESQVIVRDGEAEISTPEGSTTATRGQMITIHGARESSEYKQEDAPPMDDWDTWIRERNSKIENAQSWHDTNHNYTGSEDLDAYGQWKSVPDYGRVWVPAEAPDWAPYRDGRWVWEPYYGWTWVPYEPWGWAPYHYGRWMYYDSAWVWWPGPVVVTPYYRPLWAPAYVSFFGFGGGVGLSVGFGFGSFGWLPLGPGDYCHPWWGGSRKTFNVVNVTNITNVNNINNIRTYHPYAGGGAGLPPLRTRGFSNVQLAATNEHVMRGVSTVGAGNFGSGLERPHPIDTTTFRGGHVLTGNLPVVPTRASLAPTNRAASPTTMRSGVSRNFFGTTARPGNTQSFARQASELQQSIETSHFTPVRSGEQLTQGGAPMIAQNQGAQNQSAQNRAGQNQAGRNQTGSHLQEKDIPAGGMQNNVNKPTPGIRPESGAVSAPVNRGSGGAPTSGSNNGWTRFGSQPPATRSNVARPVQTAPSQGSPRGSSSVGNTSDGWHSFARPGSSQASGGYGNSNPGAASRRSPYSNSRPERSVNIPESIRTNPTFGAKSSNSRGSSGEYRPFTPAPTRGSQPEPSYRSSSPSNAPGRNEGGSRSYSPPSYPSGSSRASSRPPLDMRQPIVGGRSSSGSSGGGSHSGGSFGGSAPRGSSGGSSHGSAPSHGSGPSRGHGR